MYASSDSDFQEAASREALRLQQQMEKELRKYKVLI
jgi:hypothetical protein